jgi:hypothetical protein
VYLYEETLKFSAMKKLVYLSILIVLNVLRTSAQDDHQSPPYKVPDVYKFDHKVVYEINNEDEKSPQEMSFFFTDNGNYMSMIAPKSRGEDEDENFVILTKEGDMVTFGKEPVPGGFGVKRKVLKVVDMKSMYKGIGQFAEAFGKSASDEEKTTDRKASEDKSSEPNLDNFVRTGRTKNVFGYTAEEYSKHVSGMDEGKKRSGTLYAWYAKVNFDPEMMFSMGLGSLASGQFQTQMQYSHPNNLLGMGIERKDYLLTELSFVEDGGKSETMMKVVGIDKSDLTKETTDYHIENYSGMSLTQMIQQEMGKGK